MDDLSLSDSDTDALFNTPAARKNKSKAQDDDGAAPGKTRIKESHYTTEEAREVALRKELESVRNVNKVIEGVVESLQKAKDNMNVRFELRISLPYDPNADEIRRYLEPYTTHQPYFRHGPASSRRQSITNASSLILNGREQPRTLLTSKTRRSSDSKPQSAGR